MQGSILEAFRIRIIDVHFHLTLPFVGMRQRTLGIPIQQGCSQARCKSRDCLLGKREGVMPSTIEPVTRLSDVNRNQLYDS